MLAGLVFSLLGDIALMYPDKWFTAGLAAFLAAQILYILAFRPRPGHPVSIGTLLPYILFGLLMFFLLAPKLGPMKLPVFVYIAAITTMAGFAAARYVDMGGTKTLLAFLGGVLFLVSDSGAGLRPLRPEGARTPGSSSSGPISRPSILIALSI
ncbi:MAG: lysoplasmalogenase [Comamonadaceae bacterium]|nr:lysoplasmalogenase [Comamonadaceae bacterium]